MRIVADDVIRKLIRKLLGDPDPNEELGQVGSMEPVEMIFFVDNPTSLEVMWRICYMILFRRPIGGVETISRDFRRELPHKYF